MKKIILIFLIFCSIAALSSAQNPIKIGIIGLDTSHSIEFTKILNDKVSKDDYVLRYQVVAAYPYGTKNIESATSRIPKYTEQIQKYGVKITSSIDELLGMVDCIFLETNDGNLHLEQAAKVFKTGKKIFIDKPLAATLGQVLAIYSLADKYGVKFFSSSAVRFSPENVKIKNGVYGEVLGADCSSPHSIEKTHPDFGYYGIHGVEELFAVMGAGCETVTRTHSDNSDIVVGVWKDNRLGSFRALIQGKGMPYVYSGQAYTKKGAIAVGGYTGYKCLLDEILKFFDTGILPFDREETIEIFTFMKASNMSLKNGGKPVSMSQALKEGQKEAKKLMKEFK